MNEQEAAVRAAIDGAVAEVTAAKARDRRAARAAADREAGSRSMTEQVRYQIVATGEQYGSRYGSQRYDIGAESEELATAEARRAYGKRTGLADCDITIEVVGLLDADGHDVSRRKPAVKPITMQGIEEADSGTVYCATHHDDPAGFTVWVRVREKRKGVALVCVDSTNPEMVGTNATYVALSRVQPSTFKHWRKIGVVPGTSAAR